MHCYFDSSCGSCFCRCCCCIHQSRQRRPATTTTTTTTAAAAATTASTNATTTTTTTLQRLRRAELRVSCVFYLGAWRAVAAPNISKLCKLAHTTSVAASWLRTCGTLAAENPRQTTPKTPCLSTLAKPRLGLADKRAVAWS